MKSSIVLLVWVSDILRSSPSCIASPGISIPRLAASRAKYEARPRTFFSLRRALPLPLRSDQVVPVQARLVFVRLSCYSVARCEERRAGLGRSTVRRPLASVGGRADTRHQAEGAFGTERLSAAHVPSVTRPRDAGQGRRASQSLARCHEGPS